MQRFLIALLVAVVVFLAVLFVLNPLLPGIGAYAGLLGVLAGLAYFFAAPHLNR